MIGELELEKINVLINGEEKECDVLFTFDSEATFKSYIGYTDNTTSKDGRKNIYISSYNPLSTNLELEDITDSKELEMFQEVLKKLDEDANKA